MENDAVCGRCGFSLDVADNRLGIAPMLAPLVTDTAEVLSRSGHRRIERAVQHFEQRLPQVAFAAVLAPLPADVPAGIYCFWLFNRSSLSSAVEKGGANHRILLFIDTAEPRAALTIGYGLEPLISREHLESCLRTAGAPLKAGRFAEAIEAVIAELAARLVHIAEMLPKTFGYADGLPWVDVTAPPPAAGPPAGDPEPEY